MRVFFLYTLLIFIYSTKIYSQSLENKVDSLKKIHKELVYLDSVGEKLLERSKQLKNILDSFPSIDLTQPNLNFENQVALYLKKDTIWIISNGVGTINHKERRDNIKIKINELSKSHKLNIDSFVITQRKSDYLLSYKDINILSVNKLDAISYATTESELIHRIKDRLTSVIVNNKRSQKKQITWIKILKGIAVIVLFILSVISINWIKTKLKDFLTNQKGKLIKGIKIGGYDIISENQELKLLINILKLLSSTVIIITLYIGLTVLFSFYTLTEHWTDKLIQIISTPLSKAYYGIIDYIPSFISIVVIYLIFRFIVKMITAIFTEIDKENLKIPGFYPEWALPTLNIVKVVLYIFMFIIIFPYLPGSDSPVFRGVSVFLGVLFSLGSTSAIANLVSGLVITYMRPFKIGDRVKIGDTFGDVIEKNLLVTRLRTPKNEEVAIPNSNILSSKNVNYSTTSLELGLILHTEVTIGYDVKWEVVHNLLIQAAKKTENIISDKTPFVLQKSLSDFYISYELNAFTNNPKLMIKTYSMLHQNIQNEFLAAGIEILSPHYEVQRIEDYKESNIDENLIKQSEKELEKVAEKSVEVDQERDEKVVQKEEKIKEKEKEEKKKLEEKKKTEEAGFKEDPLKDEEVDPETSEEKPKRGRPRKPKK